MQRAICEASTGMASSNSTQRFSQYPVERAWKSTKDPVRTTETLLTWTTFWVGRFGGSGMGVVEVGGWVWWRFVGMCGFRLFDVGRLDKRQQKGESPRMLAVEVQSVAVRPRPPPAGTVPNEQRLRRGRQAAGATSEQRVLA
jgi:hypothetical protein